MPGREWPWLIGAIAFGGLLGPLFLDLESVLTAIHGPSGFGH